MSLENFEPTENDAQDTPQIPFLHTVRNRLSRLFFSERSNDRTEHVYIQRTLIEIIVDRKEEKIISEVVRENPEILTEFLSLFQAITDAHTEGGVVNTSAARKDVDDLIVREITLMGDYAKQSDYYSQMALDGLAGNTAVKQPSFEMFLGYARWMAKHIKDKHVKDISQETVEAYEVIPWGKLYPSAGIKKN